MRHEQLVTFSEEFYHVIKDLRKKYRHIQEDVKQFVALLERGETPGDRIQGTGDYIVYKVRVASTDMQRGKSGGFRVLYYLHTETHTIVLTIYAKTTRDDITAAEIIEIINAVLEELKAEESPDASDHTAGDTPTSATMPDG